MLKRKNSIRTLRRALFALVALAFFALSIEDLVAQGPYYQAQEHFPRTTRLPIRSARALPANPFPAVYANPPAPAIQSGTGNQVRYAALNKTFANGTTQDVFGENPQGDIFDEENSAQQPPGNPFEKVDPTPPSQQIPQNPFGVLPTDPTPITPPMDTRPKAPQNNAPQLPPGFEFTPNPGTIPSVPPVPGGEDPPTLQGPIELPDEVEVPTDPAEAEEDPTDEDPTEDSGESVFERVDPRDEDPIPQPASSRVYLPAKTPSDYENGAAKSAFNPNYDPRLAAQTPYSGLPGPYGYGAVPPQGLMPLMPPHMLAQMNAYAYGAAYGAAYGQCGPGCKPIGGQCGPGCMPINQEENRCGLLADSSSIPSTGGCDACSSNGACSDCNACSNTSRPRLPRTCLGDRIVETGCIDACGDCGDDAYTEVVSCGNQYDYGNQRNFYVSGFVGGSFVDDFVTRGDVGNGVYFDDTGTVFGFAFGQIQGRNLRTEVELSYRSIDINGLLLENGNSSQFVDVNGDFGTFAGMFNGYWEFANMPMARLKPYVGGGVGFAIARPELLQAGGVEAVIDNSDSSFAYQWMAGLNFRASQRLEAFVEYRYFVADSFELNTEIPEVAGLGNGSGEFDYKSGNVIFGMRARF